MLTSMTHRCLSSVSSGKIVVSTLFVTLMILVIAASGCQNEADSGDSSTSEELASYDTRGIIISLPTEVRTLQIHHERIEEFVGRSGEIEPMDIMVMPFPLADGVSLDGFSVGDKVALTFEVSWSADNPGHWLTDIEKLPADTELKLKKEGAEDLSLMPESDIDLHHHDHDHHHHDHDGHDH